MRLDEKFDERHEMEMLNRYIGGQLPKALNEKIQEIENKHVVNFEEEINNLRPDSRTIELEHVVRMYKRPSLLIRDGVISQTLSEEWKQILETYAENINSSVAAVGRIELKNHESLDWNGSGFLIPGNRIVTNRHVAKDFAERDGEGFKWKTNTFSGKYVRANVDFFEEHKNPDDHEIRISDVEYIANENEEDIAILKLASDPGIDAIDFLYDVEPNQTILTVGYPWKDSRVTSKLEEIHYRIFNDIYNVKRAAPGIVLESHQTRFHHDCSVLMGNSGSACLDVETGSVVGVHYAGAFSHNRAVPARKIAEVANLV